MSELSIGIDVGTTSVKLCALDAGGAVVGIASSHHGIDPAAGGVQADPDLWWASVARAFADLGADLDLTRVRAVGMSGNMSSVVLVGSDHRPLAPALLLADRRGEEELEALSADVRTRILDATGNLPQPVFSLSSLLWWRATAPDLLRRASAWLSAKDDVRLRLTGEVATDPTDAYNSLLLTEADWDPALIAAVGLGRSLFPPVLGSGACAGTVTHPAAAATGLPVGTPVATGSGDVPAALAGMGGLPDGVLAVSLGTSVTLMAGLGAGRRPPLPAAATGALTVHPTSEGSWFALGSLLTGGLALNWLRSLLGADALVDVPSSPDPESGLVFLPYLAGTGSPDFVSTATGAILGITPTTTGPQLVVALFEAIAFDLAGLVDRLGAGRWSRVVLSGGGGRISAWPQVIADVLGLPVDVVDESDLSAVGAAVHGWRAVGRDVAPALTTTAATPRPGTAASWAARRHRYETARRAAIDLTQRSSLENGRQADDPHRHR